MMSLMLLQQTPAPHPPFPPVPGGPPEAAIFGFIAIVIVVVVGIVIFPLIRALARRLESKGADPALRGEVEHLRARVAELEQMHQRMAELEERVDFSERLLTQRSAEPLPRGRDS